MKKIVTLYRKLMNTHNRTLMLLELALLFLFLVLLLPLINYGFKLTLDFWGQSYITSKNILSYLTYPPTLLYLVLVILLISLFLLFLFIVLIGWCNNEYTKNKTSILRHLLTSLLKIRRCFSKGNIALPIFTVCFFVFTNIPLLVGLTLQAQPVISVSAAKIKGAKAILIIVYSLISFISFQGMFAIQYFISERQSFLRSFNLSKALLSKRKLKTARILFTYNIILIILSIAVYYVVLLFAAVFICLTVEKSMVITVFLSVYPRFNGIMLTLFHMIVFITNINIITTLFHKYRVEDLQDVLPKGSPEQDYGELIRKKFLKVVLSCFLIFLVVAGLINAYFTVRNDSFYIQKALSGIQISSHRGNSHVAPENTLPALENAILANSDYAEIDVRQTKDGVLILLHDDNLLRTAGLNKHIWALNYDEVVKLDAGAWFGVDFIMTRIPTLEETLKLCKGRIKLNIEIKSDHREYNLEEHLVELIHAYDFENQCVVSSSDSKVLARIKELDENIKTGLIISAAYGNFYEKETVDFFSIRSRYISRQVVENAHASGKEVYAWTVNSVGEMERMKSVGVDCIITDNPTLARQVLNQDDTSKSFIELIKRMLNSRFLYQFLP